MIWAKWQGTVTAAVVGASMAFGQGSATTSVGSSPTEESIMLREPGKPDTKCRVVRAQRQTNGLMSYEVQAVDTGESITVVELGSVTNICDTPNGTCIRGVPTHIYHWGQQAPAALTTQDAAARYSPSVPINDRGTAAIQQAGYSSPAPTPFNGRGAAVIQQVGYNGPAPLEGGPAPSMTMPASMPAPTMETFEAPPPPPPPPIAKSPGLFRRLFRKDSSEPVMNQAPMMSRTMLPSGVDSDLSGLGTRSVLAAGENLDKVKFVVPGPTVPVPNSQPPYPPGVTPPRQYAPAQYANQIPGAMPASASVNPEMMNAFVGGPGANVQQWSPADANAFTRPPDEMMMQGQVVDGARRGLLLHRLLHRVGGGDANQEPASTPAPGGTMPTGDAALASSSMGAGGASETQAMANGQPRTLPSSVTLAQATSAMDGESGQPLAVLHNSMLPSQREMAADTLAGTDWRSNPAVVSALLRSAREDPAPSVRSACVRSLVRMNVNSGVAMSTLQALKCDTDAQVRSDATAAVAAMAAATSASQGIQPTSYIGHSPSR